MWKKGAQTIGKEVGAKVTQTGMQAGKAVGRFAKKTGEDVFEEEFEEKVIKGKKQGGKAKSIGGTVRDVGSQVIGKNIRQQVGSTAQKGVSFVPAFEGTSAGKQAISRFTRGGVKLPTYRGRMPKSGPEIVEMPLIEGTVVRSTRRPIGRMRGLKPAEIPTKTPTPSRGGMLRGRIFQTPTTIRVSKPRFTLTPKTPEQQIMETLGYRAPKVRAPITRPQSTPKAQLKDLKMRKDIARQQKEVQRKLLKRTEQQSKETQKVIKELEAEYQAKQRAAELREAEEILETLARQQKRAAELRTQRAAEEAPLEQLRNEWKEKVAEFKKQEELQALRMRRAREQKAREKQFIEMRGKEKVPKGMTTRLSKQLRERELKRRAVKKRGVAKRKASLRRGFQESRARRKEQIERARIERERELARERRQAQEQKLRQEQRERIEREQRRLAREHRPGARSQFAQPTRFIAPVTAAPEYTESTPEPIVRPPELGPPIELPPIEFPELPIEVEEEAELTPTEERVEMIPVEEPVMPLVMTHGYQEIYRITTTPSEQLLTEIAGNPMHFEWAEGSVGIEQMIEAFNDQFKLLQGTLIGLATDTNIYSPAVNQLKFSDFERMKQVIARKMEKELNYLGIPLTR